MKYICQVCGYVYDEEKEGKGFDALPESWKCPLCGAPRSEFRPQQAASPAPAAALSRPAAETAGNDAGRLAALCSSLARGCEKL